MSFELTDGDKHSALWAKLFDHFITKREGLRVQNDGPHDATKTAEIRGQIKTYTTLIGLNKDRE